jgi:hypothetical protein
MRCSKIAVALAAGGIFAIAGTANATIAMTTIGTAAGDLTAVEQVQFIFGGRRHCWYPDGWHGPGWYWCGYRWRHGLGWGGGEGFRGWRHR